MAVTNGLLSHNMFLDHALASSLILLTVVLMVCPSPLMFTTCSGLCPEPSLSAPAPLTKIFAGPLLYGKPSGSNTEEDEDRGIEYTHPQLFRAHQYTLPGVSGPCDDKTIFRRRKHGTRSPSPFTLSYERTRQSVARGRHYTGGEYSRRWPRVVSANCVHGFERFILQNVQSDSCKQPAKVTLSKERLFPGAVFTV